MNKKILSVKDSALSWVLAFAFGQIAVMVFTLLGGTIASAFGADLTKFNNFLNNSIGYGISMLVLDLALVGVFIFFNKNKENNIVSKPKILKILMYILIATLTFFMLYPIITCLDNLFVKLGAKLADIPYPLTTKNYVISIFSLALVPAICEELIFRGLIFKGLKKYGKAVSIGLSAIMFAIFHMSYQQLVYPLLMGLLLGVIMYYENNIIYTITMHFVNNFLSITINYLKINLSFSHWTYILLAIVLLVAFLVVLCYFIFNKKNTIPKQKIELGEKKYLIISFAIMIFLWVIINIFNKS